MGLKGFLAHGQTYVQYDFGFIGPSECVRQRLALHTLVENVVSTINTIIFLFCSSAVVTFLPEGAVLGIFR